MYGYMVAKQVWCRCMEAGGKEEKSGTDGKKGIPNAERRRHGRDEGFRRKPETLRRPFWASEISPSLHKLAAVCRSTLDSVKAMALWLASSSSSTGMTCKHKHDQNSLPDIIRSEGRKG